MDCSAAQPNVHTLQDSCDDYAVSRGFGAYPFDLQTNEVDEPEPSNVGEPSVIALPWPPHPYLAAVSAQPGMVGAVAVLGALALLLVVKG